jgi:hypothetical protein
MVMKHSAALFMSFMSLVGMPCSKEEAAAPDAAPVVVAVVDAAPAPVAEPEAKNAAKIGRFPNETKLGMEKEKLLADITIARESPGAGTLVASLPKDVEVTKVASRGDHFLVAFADPKDASSILEGWIDKSAFTASPPGPKVAAPCSVKGEVRFVGAACKLDCSKTPCPAGMACTGLAPRPEVGPGAFPYCESAGAAPTPPPPTPIACSGNLVMHTDNKCHTKCTTNKDCAGKGTCTPFGNGVSGCL